MHLTYILFRSLKTLAREKLHHDDKQLHLPVVVRVFCPVIPSFSSVRRRSLRLLRSIYHATCHEDTIITSSGQPSTIRSYREQARVNPENVCVFNKLWQVTCDGKDGQSGSSSGDPCFEIRQNRSVKFSYLKLY